MALIPTIYNHKRKQSCEAIRISRLTNQTHTRLALLIDALREISPKASFFFACFRVQYVHSVQEVGLQNETRI